MVGYRVFFSKQADKDKAKLKAAGLEEKARRILAILTVNPFQVPPPFEKLVGDLEGKFSRRINLQHRIVYEVDKTCKTVKILRMWTHYE